MTKLALLIGVSDYEPGFNTLPAALKDVEAMQRVLVHPEMGDFDEANVVVLKNPQRQEMEDAIYKLFANRQRDDLLLFYFSGHGVKDDSGKLYLSSRATRKEYGRLVKHSAVAANFLHETINESRSKRQVIILDCCFSGAIAFGMTVKDDGAVNVQEQLGGEGRAILTSSTSTQYSFEQKDSELSLYTHYLVEGIEKGTAEKDGDGWISVDELHEYVSTKVKEISPTMTPMLYPVKGGYKILLAKARCMTLNQKPEVPKSKVSLGVVNLGTVNPSDSEVLALNNFLMPYEPLITQLITQLQEHPIKDENNSENHNRILEIIRHSSKADLVFFLQSDLQNNWIVKSQSNFAEGIDEHAYVYTLKSSILPNFSQDLIFNPDHHGIYKIHKDNNGNRKAFALVPLQTRPKSEIIVVCGIPEDSYLLGDAYGRIISTFYQTSLNLSLKPLLVEAAILDDLKRDYGFVSLSLYNKRFELFCRRLNQMIVHFEPILNLETLEISGWEALARDTDNFTAPGDLFQAAELWGPRFTIELDKYFLTVAAESYYQALKKAKLNRPNDIKPLSVNVYPESLMRTAYMETVRKIIKNKLIPNKKLILEISEKTHLPQFQDGLRLKNPLQFFNKRLEEYSKLGVRFAIDDFGVGYASVSHLAGITLPYVKIDREILFHKPGDLIIRFVHDLVVAAHPHNPADVILEGLDETSPITLYHLKEIGVTFVQGYLVGKATAEIYNRISKEKYDLFKGLLMGKDN